MRLISNPNSSSDTPEGEELKAAARKGGEVEGGLIGGLVSDVIGGLIGY